MVANSFSEVPIYMDRLSTWISTTSTIKLHRARLDKLEAYVALGLGDGAVGEGVREMKARMDDLVSLLEEMEVGFLKKISDGMRGRLSAMWAFLGPRLLGDSGVDLAQIQCLLQAFADAYPDDEAVEKMRLEQGQALQTKSGE